MILRRLSKKVNKAIKLNPAVVILGPRQVGKTTLALKQIDPGTKEILYLDLERPSDLLKLSDAEFFLSNQQVKLVVIDEVQRMPELFPILRSLIDENREAGRFILLGSASDKLIGMSAESLAGRVSYQELHPFSLDEVGNDRLTKLWITGGFPVAFQATNNEESFEWLGDFVRTYIERELGVSELKVDSIQLSMFLRIIASIHGQLINYSQLANVMQISMSNIKKYINFFEQAYLLRTIQPYHSNNQKRLVKTPKIYIRDSGILHYLRGINSIEDLEGDIIKGYSWEGFVIQQIIAMLKPSIQTYFYRTSNGAEVDLVLIKGNDPFVAFEIKYSNSPKITKGTTEGLTDLNCPYQYIITPNSEKYELRKNLWVIGISDIYKTLKELDLLNE